MGVARTFETYRLPLKTAATGTVAAGATADITITVPDNDLYFIKTITVNAGATTAVNSIRIDGVDTEEVTSFDTQNVFGAVISAWKTITMNVTNNSATAAEDSTVSIVGYYSFQ